MSKQAWQHNDNAGRHRGGKTEADRRNGAHKTAANNRDLRGAYTRWCKDVESAKATTETASARFPSHTCRGKGNSSKAKKYAFAKAAQP